MACLAWIQGQVSINLNDSGWQDDDEDDDDNNDDWALCDWYRGTTECVFPTKSTQQFRHGDEQ